MPVATATGLTREALGELFNAFSRTSREIERSHAELKAKVVELRRELAEKDRRLERKKRLEALGLVVAGVAHEFRNPLGSVSLYLDCLADAVSPLPEREAAEARAVIGKIETAVRHLNAVVEDMLIFTRGPSGPGQPCDLARLVDEAILLLSGDLEAAGVGCRTDVEPGLRLEEGGPAIVAERDQVVRIVVNVLKNAVQAAASVQRRGEGRVAVMLRRAAGDWRLAEDGRRGSASVGARRLGEFLEVEVEDNGPGVPPERIERLFVPFYTEKEKGVGLGLYIVHSLLERQGGRVEVENLDGGFRVRLFFAVGGARTPDE